MKLFRLLALLACFSLIVAGGNWVHHAHVGHAYNSAHLDLPNHMHINGIANDDVANESLIHCGSDNVWFVPTWMPSQDLTAKANCALEHIIAVSIHLQVEKPPPRLIVL